ncbi:MAG: hypothetical protein JF590_02035 [Gemmatimonadetes bacterium]|nr:hypothetical protein [Gemmatimonadota bacterium]
MRRALLVLALCTAPALLAAQGPGGSVGGFGGRGGMGGRPMMPRRAGVEMPSEDVMRGPFPPDSMAQKFGLDSTQTERYRASWDSMMAASRPVRDSLHQAVEGMRRARTEGYQHEGDREAGMMRHFGKVLKKDSDHFDGVIRRILTKDQWGDFKDWRKRRRDTEKQLRQQGQFDGGMRRGEGRRRDGGS